MNVDYAYGYCGYTEDIVQLLLDEGVNVDTCESLFQWTPILTVAWTGHIEIFDMLLDAQTSLTAKDKQGQNVLMILAQRPHSDMLEHVLNKEIINVDDVDNFGRTALYIAVQMQLESNVSVLCCHHVNMEISDQDGRKPLDLAYQLGFLDIADILVEAGAECKMNKLKQEGNIDDVCKQCSGEFIRFIDFVPNTKLMVFCESADKVWGGLSDGSIVIWDLFSLELLVYYQHAQKRTIHHMVATNNGDIWSLSDTFEICVWRWNDYAISTSNSSSSKECESINSQKIILIATYKPSGEIQCITKYEHLIYGGSTKMVHVWNTRNGNTSTELQLDTSTAKIEDYENWVSSIACRGNELYCVIKNYVFSYEIVGDDKVIFKQLFEGHMSLITGLIMLEDNLWTCSRDDSIRVWDITSKECIKVFEEAGGGEVGAICAIGERQMLSGGLDGRIRTWDMKNLSCKITFDSQHQQRLITCIYWNKNCQRLWIGCLDKQVSLWK